MEKIRSFLGVLVSLFVISIPGKVLAADVYACNELIEYVECNANFYLAGNTCEACPSGQYNFGNGNSQNWQSTTPDANSSAACECPEFWAAQGGGNQVIYGEVCVPQTIECKPGEYFDTGTKKCTICPAGYYCPGGEIQPANVTLNGGKINCPKGYPYSETGAKAITECYRGETEVKWTGVQKECKLPENCASVKCEECSLPNCKFKIYCNADGQTDAPLPPCDDPCEQKIIGLEANQGAYTVGTEGCKMCPEKYQDGPGVTSEADCVYYETKYGKQLDPALPSGCTDMKLGTCTPKTCQVVHTYGGETTPCTPQDCTKPITSVTAAENNYASGTSCIACEAGYTAPAGATDPKECTKQCSVKCTKPTCPENSENCEITESFIVGKENQVDKVCDAVPQVCEMTFSCKKGYKEYEGQCIPETYTVSYNCGTGGGVAPGGSSQQYGGQYQIAANTCTKPGFNFVGWGDGTSVQQPGKITWNYTSDITFTAQWEPCPNDPSAVGTCGCAEKQYPNGNGCSDCVVSCQSEAEFNQGSYNVCNSETTSRCYRNCTTSDVSHSSAVTGTITKGGTNTCKASACLANYFVDNGQCMACVENATCPGGTESFKCNTGYHTSADGDSCEPDEYKITLNKNGGTGDINGYTGTTDAVQECQHGVLCYLPTEGLTRTGYAFTGWGDNAGCTSGVFQGTFTSSKTLYACWSQQTTQCQAGKYYDGENHIECPSGKFCPGTGSANIGQPGCASDCPTGYDGSTPGASAATACYKNCGGKSITGGTATVVAPKVFYNGSSYPACTYNVTCNEGYVAAGQGTAGATCTKCQDGEYCPGGSGETTENCPAGSYCEEGVKKACPVGGTSQAGAGSIDECYKVCPPTLDIPNGQGISTGNQYYDGSKYPECLFTANCDENYVATNSPGTNPSCIWGDPSDCPVGYYCPEDGSGPIPCPDGGTSLAGSTEVTQCYKIFDPYSEFKNGVASAKCYYIEQTSKYERCNILEVQSCNAGYWYATPNAFLCSGTESGYYSPESDITQTACPADPSGGAVESSEYADSFTDCYKTCAIDVPNSTSVAAENNTVYGISADAYAACSFAVTCKTGYTVVGNNTEAPSCKANEYTITLNKNGGNGSVPASVKCTFDSGNCELPATTGLTKSGYTVVNKWCSDANGGTPCYTAGSTVSTNISANGQDITLYATWTPNVYAIQLDHQNADVTGTPSTAYLKYATGWFNNASGNSPLTNMTRIPTKTGYEFAGYYSAVSGGTQVINATGLFQTTTNALTFTAAPATIYARWAAGTTTCDAGSYYPGTGTVCSVCTENNYCPGGSFATDSGRAEGLYACPSNGISPSGASDISECYKTGLTYTATHGSGTQTCYYNSTEFDYTSACKDKKITLCHAGYYLTETSDTDCNVVGIGYYSQGTGTSRTQCPSNGLTESDTSTMIQDCYKDGVPYTAVYGSGTQRCFYSSGAGASAIYQRDCDTKVINSCWGGYWLENPDDTDCVPVGQNYYSNTGDIERFICPSNGKTESNTAEEITQCYKDGLPYTAAQHGAGEYLCYYTSGTGDDAIYASSCETPTMTSCDAGYYYNKVQKVDDCIAVGIGYYSPELEISRSQCPDNGLTETTTSAAITECYKTGLSCVITNGKGEQTCNYNPGTSNYTGSCQPCVITQCDEGFSLVDNACITCPAGSVCYDGKQQTCSELTGGQYTESDPGTTDVAKCYKNCTLAENAVSMSGRDYYTAPDTCSIDKCISGYVLDNNSCTQCPSGSYCDGMSENACTGLGDGSWANSLPGASDANSCYKTCETHPVINGTAIPIKDTVFYPEECEFRGESDSGNPCEIIDGVCVESSCSPDQEMKNGACVPCDRENALSYKPTGNCQVASCIYGYHPRGDMCEYDIKECTIPNAVYAEQKWDNKLQAFGPCKILECDDRYHLASNACVSNIQQCNVNNGVGFKEWDSAKNTWGKCVANECDPGYTSDPSETDDKVSQCGECKNKYSSLGEIAVSSYVRGCEIASCMYQGELYNLENNECVPICPQEVYEDETGTMVWDKNKKKCVRTCKDGYTMW